MGRGGWGGINDSCRLCGRRELAARGSVKSLLPPPGRARTREQDRCPVARAARVEPPAARRRIGGSGEVWLNANENPYPRELTISAERWQKTRDFMVETNLLKADTDWRKAFNTDFVRDLRVLPAAPVQAANP